MESRISDKVGDLMKESGTSNSNWVQFFEGGSRNIFSQCLGNRRLIELVLANTSKGGRILEAGCGTALLSLILADCGYAVTALDFTKEVLDYARKRVGEKPGRLSFVQGDIRKLSDVFAVKHFDTVCHSGVMEHFSDQDIVVSLAEQRKISSKVVFSVPNDRNVLTPGHFGDERFMSNRKWLSLIAEAGFQECSVYGGYDLPKGLHLVLPGAFFNRKLSFWWKWASKHSLFVCRR